MATGSLMPNVFPQYFDTNGDPLVGGKLYSHLAGTSTLTPTYTDSTLLVPHANPIILDGAGRSGAVYLDALSYKFTLHTALDVLVCPPVDNVQAVHLNQSVLGEVYTFGGDSTSPIEATSYPAGATIDKTHAGTAIFRLNTTNLPAGTYVLEGMLLAIGGTVSASIVNLSDGAPDVPLTNATITSTSATGELVVGALGITFAVAGANKDYAIKTKVSAGLGFAWGIKLRRTA